MTGPQMHKDRRELTPVVVILGVLVIACLLAIAFMPFVWTAWR